MLIQFDHKEPYTEVYVFEGDKILNWIQNELKLDIFRYPDKSSFK